MMITSGLAAAALGGMKKMFDEKMSERELAHGVLDLVFDNFQNRVTILESDNVSLREKIDELENKISSLESDLKKSQEKNVRKKNKK